MNNTLSKEDAEDLFNSSGTEINSKEDAEKLFNSSGTEVPPSNIINNIATSAKSAIKSVGTGISDAARSEFNQGIGEDLLDTSRGIGQGLTMGAADELGAIPSSLIESLYNKFNPTDVDLRSKGFKIDQPGLSDLYRQNQQSIQKEFESSANRSPIGYTAGQLAGGITSGSAIGGALGIGGEAAGDAPKLLDIARDQGKMKALGELLKRGGTTYAQALPTIALEGALSSKKGGLTSLPEAQELGKDVVGSAMFGLPAVMGLQAATEVAAPMARNAANAIKGKVQGIVGESPLLRQTKVSYDYGVKNINPKSEFAQMIKPGVSGSGILAHEESSNTNELLDNLMQPRQAIGKDIENSLNQATNDNVIVPFKDKANTILDSIKDVSNVYPGIKKDEKLNYLANKLAKSESLNPLETHDLIDYTDAFLNKLKPSVQDPNIGSIIESLNDTRQNLLSTLKQSVPEYAKHAERYSNFMQIPEQLLAGDVPLANKNIFYSRVNNADDRAYLKMRQLVQGSTASGSISKIPKTATNNLIDKMQNFEGSELQKVANGELPASSMNTSTEDFANKLRSYSDKSNARGNTDALAPQTGVTGTIKQVLTGTGETGRAMVLSGANLAGRLRTPINAGVTKNPVAQISRAIYNAPDATVTALAQKLKGSPGVAKYGEQLEHALSSPDTNRRNQVLFTIMQNPSARAFVGDQAEEPQE